MKIWDSYRAAGGGRGSIPFGSTNGRRDCWLPLRQWKKGSALRNAGWLLQLVLQHGLERCWP